MKATARSHPVQGLIKYHLVDDRLRLPFHDTISVCTAPFCTVATVAFQQEKEVVTNGCAPDPVTVSRIDSIIFEVKHLSGVDLQYKVVSESNFPSNTGLGASSSECAALAVAASEAAGLDLSHKELSRIAGRGTQSAPTSVTGYFSRWRANMDEKFCYSFVMDDDLDMGMVAALVESEPINTYKVTMSPFLELRLKSVHTSLYEMERAIKDHDIPKIGQLVEKDTILMHALTTAENKKSVMWRPDTLRVMAEVIALREEGVEAYFSCDRGAVYINSYPEDVLTIEERITALGIKAVPLSVGGEAHLIDSHLF
jgi:phosphomevalonate decarboxylase